MQLDNERAIPANGFVSPLDAELRARALKVVPGGMYGHLDARKLPLGYPQYFAKANGCRIWDADGREYLDFMCSWGPVVVGHRHPEVEAAVARQSALGDCFNGPTERFVELAERLVGLLPHADWAMFQKNGTDATTAAVTIARASTRRRKVLVAKGAYHGAIPWCSPSVAGVTDEDRAHFIPYTFNNVESLETAAAQAGDDLAAILVSAFKHDLGLDQALPTPEFAEKARALCDAKRAALVLDEVRAGFRLSLRGSWESLGVRPDLCAWSKAIANGYALAAVTGNEQFREGAASVFITGSFWMGGVAMAAALATLDVLESSDAIAHFENIGSRLRDGLASQALRHGVRIRQTGPVQMPMVLFEDDPGQVRGSAFVTAALSRGVYLHPRHNMFISLAHSERDIDEALLATDYAFEQVARSHG